MSTCNRCSFLHVHFQLAKQSILSHLIRFVCRFWIFICSQFSEWVNYTNWVRWANECEREREREMAWHGSALAATVKQVTAQNSLVYANLQWLSINLWTLLDLETFNPNQVIDCRKRINSLFQLTRNKNAFLVWKTDEIFALFPFLFHLSHGFRFEYVSAWLVVMITHNLKTLDRLLNVCQSHSNIPMC